MRTAGRYRSSLLNSAWLEPACLGSAGLGWCRKNASNFQNCRSYMRFAIAGCIFSVHFWSSFWGFGAPAKKRPQRRARITSVHFFLAKNRKFLLRFGTISRTWHNFSKDQLLWTNRPRIRAVFLPNSAVC